VRGHPYTVFGYKGKQVRDQIHAHDVVNLFFEYFRAPRSGEVYNLGGGRKNSISILETIKELDCRGFPLNWSYEDRPRTGDHICYISNTAKLRAHFPNWNLQYDLPQILDQIILHYSSSGGRQ
jgi:CDP-paratose 2-epimerase